MPGDILEVSLPCGLTVRLMEMHTAPIVSHWLWYRVGSRDEPEGKTGISHWVEHMQFKGSERHPAAQTEREIARVGGLWNALTYLDWTAYYETLPADYVSLAIDIEADRMRNMQYHVEEVESERGVILAEREGSENEPLFRLNEAIQRAGFQTHPYRNEVIGLREDLLHLTAEDLQGWYRERYQPANAVLCLAGDFQTAAVLETITRSYEGFATSPLQPRTALAEAAPSAETQLEVSGAGETTYLQLSYRAPAAQDPDFDVLTVIDSLLSGPASLNMFGGGSVSNRTSRLYRALVEGDLAAGVTGGLQATLDPFLFDIVLTLRKETPVERVLPVFDGEIARLQDDLVTQEELARAVKQARALFAYGTEHITNQAFWLGFAPMFAGYDWFTGYLTRLAAVTPEDVQRVARAYLTPTRRVVGVYRPDGRSPEEGL